MNRPEKLSHRDTVIYEIDMLEYCYEKLVLEKEPLGNRAGYALLECLLLHYRNLIEFFGKNERLRDDDLSISRPDDWGQHGVATDEQRKKLEEGGRGLWTQYEWRSKDDQNKDTISRYLQHCTTQRTEPKDWPVNEMYERITPLIEGFRRLSGGQYRVAVDDRKAVVGEVSASTMTSRTFRVTDENK